MYWSNVLNLPFLFPYGFLDFVPKLNEVTSQYKFLNLKGWISVDKSQFWDSLLEVLKMLILSYDSLTHIDGQLNCYLVGWMNFFQIDSKENFIP